MTLGARFFLVIQSKLARCLSRDEGLENALPHFSQVYGLAPVCMLIWNFSSYDCAKAFPQYSHTHGFSFVCVRRTWLSCAACEANARSQCLHLNGFSPLCWRMWVRRMEDAVKALTQWGHLYGLSPLCTLICLLRLEDWEKRFPQTVHSWGRCFSWTWSTWMRRRSRLSKERLHTLHGNFLSPVSMQRVYFRWRSR